MATPIFLWELQRSTFCVWPCKDLLFPHGPNLTQKPLYLVGTVLNCSIVMSTSKENKQDNQQRNIVLMFYQILSTSLVQ